MRIAILNPAHPAIGSRVPREHLPPLGLLAVGGALVDAGHEVRLIDGEIGAGGRGEGMPVGGARHAFDAGSGGDAAFKIEGGACGESPLTASKAWHPGLTASKAWHPGRGRWGGAMTAEAMAGEAAAWGAEVVMVGHSGSTSGHPAACAVMRAVRRRMPGAVIVYGGVFPTFHWREIMEAEEAVDLVVRGEGERTVCALVAALEAGRKDGSKCGIWRREGMERKTGLGLGLGSRLRLGSGSGGDLGEVEGIAYRRKGRVVATPAARVIEDLDAYRVGWELVDLRRYSYWGDKRAVVVQFSRGCPHMCSYCGQRGFWGRWRHRDPVKFAAEIAWLHREQGVEVFNFADENPTADRTAWKAFLEALIATGVKVTLVGSTRADDIVRDADILELYKRAGVARWLLGIESYDEETLKKIRKGGSVMKDRRAIELLREHGILAMATWVVGFAEERDRDYLRGLRQLLAYDPDQIQMLYATPHWWTAYFQAEKGRRVIQTDLSKWDYKHQVMATRHVPAWRVMLWVKLIEAVMQMRPRALGRVLWHRDLGLRAAQRWYYRIGRKVWFYEIWKFLFGDRRVARGPTVGEFWGREVEAEERGGRLVCLAAEANGVD